MVARISGASKYIHEVILITAFYGSAHLVKVTHYLIENNQYRIFVGQRYITPHYRITRRYAGKIPKSSGGITEYFMVIPLRSQCIDQ